jgi:glycerophosphoryl diester phosphodiesterase
VLAGSFLHAALRPFRAGVSRSGSRREVARFWAAARLRLPPFRVGYHAFTVPEVSGPLTVVDAPFVRRARRLGLPVHVWTVDDVGRAAQLRSLGVAGIITNFPGRFRPS